MAHTVSPRQIDEIDIVHLVKVLIRFKWLIIGGVALSALAVFLLTLAMPRIYKSEGFLQLSQSIDVDLKEMMEIQEKIKYDLKDKYVGSETLFNNMLLNMTLQNNTSLSNLMMMKNVSLPDYKKYLPQFSSPAQFLAFLAARPDCDRELLTDIKKSTRIPEDIEKWVEPVHAYSKTELKDLATTSRDLKNFVLGVNVSGEQTSPEKARQYVSLLGAFIKNSVIYGKLSEYIESEWSKNKADAFKADNRIIKLNFRLEQLLEKRQQMEEVLKKYPQASVGGGRELVSVENSGHRFLSPVTQLVGIASSIADIREELSRQQRSKILAELKYRFLTSARRGLETEHFSDPLLKSLLELLDSGFLEPQTPPDILKEARTEIAMDIDAIISLRDEMRFISAPSTPNRPIKPQKTLILAITLMASFFLFVTLAITLEWWKSNKKKIEN